MGETVGPGLGPEETWRSELGYRRSNRPAEIGKTLERQEAYLRTEHRFQGGGRGVRQAQCSEGTGKAISTGGDS